MSEDDRNFIFSAWLNSFRFSPSVAGIHLDASNRVVCPASMVVRGKQMETAKQDTIRVEKILSPGISDTVYFYEQRKLIERLLDTCTIDLMCSVEDPDIVIGFACTEVQDGIPVVHYLYVKKDFRKQGHALALLKNRGISKATRCFFTHQPPPVFSSAGVLLSNWKDAWLRKSGWVANTFIALYGATTQEKRE